MFKRFPSVHPSIIILISSALQLFFHWTVLSKKSSYCSPETTRNAFQGISPLKKGWAGAFSTEENWSPLYRWGKLVSRFRLCTVVYCCGLKFLQQARSNYPPCTVTDLLHSALLRTLSGNPRWPDLPKVWRCRSNVQSALRCTAFRSRSATTVTLRWHAIERNSELCVERK